MQRAEVIERLMPAVEKPTYLEIGVQHGLTFHAVKAHRKVAVDPYFPFDVAEKKAAPNNSGCSYYQTTSNDYFANIWSEDDLFDLIFIDGLHTFDQTLKDLLSVIRCLKPGGVILVDDVMPVSYASSISDFDQFTRFREKIGLQEGSWMGDVYKLVFFVRDYLTQFSYATVAENCAQMVMWQVPSPKKDGSLISVESICRLTYADFELERDVLKLMPITEIARHITAGGAN